MIDVFIVCDSPLIGEGLQRLVESDDIRCSRSGSFHTAEVYGVVVFVAGQESLNRPAFRDYLQVHPSARLLVIGCWLPDDFAYFFRDQGAFGFLNQKASRLELIEAIRMIDTGNFYFEPHLGTRPSRRREPVDAPLSQREMEVLHGILRGKSIKEIAHGLEISVKTASTYRRRLLDKLGFETNAELIVWGLQKDATKGHLKDQGL